MTHSTQHTQTNVVGTAEMLDGLSNSNRFPEHIILTSSRAVYGEGAWLSPDGSVFYPSIRSLAQLQKKQWAIFDSQGRKSTPLAHCARSVVPNPSSIYGATKLAQENLLKTWCNAHEIPLTIFRLQNVYGRGQSPYNPYTGIINIFINQALDNEAINVFEDDEIGRDFVHVSDVVLSIMASINVKPKANKIIDVGSGKITTIKEIANCISEHFCAPSPKISGMFRVGDIRSAVANIGDLAGNLEVTPKTKIEDGFIEVAEWLREIRSTELRSTK